MCLCIWDFCKLQDFRATLSPSLFSECWKGGFNISSNLGFRKNSVVFTLAVETVDQPFPFRGQLGGAWLFLLVVYMCLETSKGILFVIWKDDEELSQLLHFLPLEQDLQVYLQYLTLLWWGFSTGPLVYSVFELFHWVAVPGTRYCYFCTYSAWVCLLCPAGRSEHQYDCVSLVMPILDGDSVLLCFGLFFF